jgi:hypothetical protein
MKKILASLVLLSGIVQAQELRTLQITNLTYPENQIMIECLDYSCEAMSVKSYKNGNEVANRFLNKTVLLKTISKRRKVVSQKWDPYTPYELSQNAVKPIKKHFKEAYYGKVVGSMALTTGAAIVDTLALPISAISVVAAHKVVRLDSTKDKKAAKRILRNLESPLDEMIIKHKYYKEIIDYLSDATSSQKVDEQDFTGIFDEFLNGSFVNCYVKTGVDGWATQVYVNDEFRGNYSNSGNNHGNVGSWQQLISHLIKLDEQNICKRM